MYDEIDGDEILLLIIPLIFSPNVSIHEQLVLYLLYSIRLDIPFCNFVYFSLRCIPLDEPYLIIRGINIIIKCGFNPFNLKRC
jgi:hypothetical protein